MTRFTAPAPDDNADGRTYDPDPPPPPQKRDALFAQLDAWKAKGYVVSFVSASSDMDVQGTGTHAGWALRLETPGSIMRDDRASTCAHLRVTTEVCPMPEDAIRAMLRMVQP